MQGINRRSGDGFHVESACKAVCISAWLVLGMPAEESVWLKVTIWSGIGYRTLEGSHE